MGLLSRPRRHGGHKNLRRRRLVPERSMRPQSIVVPSPALDHDLRLLERIEDLTIEQLIPEPGIEALDEPILPRTARSDVSRLCPHSGDVGPFRAQPDAGSVGKPQTPSLGLFSGSLQPLPSPDPLDPLVVDGPAGGRTQKLCDLPVAVASILTPPIAPLRSSVK